MTKRITRVKTSSLLSWFSEAYLWGAQGSKIRCSIQEFYPQQSTVNSSLVRDFIEGLSKYPPDTLGIFVAPSGHTQSSLELAEGADYDILLLNTSNLIKNLLYMLIKE
ncbi:unnamed protein product [Rhizophagus irregularis]|nr:unnamed protein product [Rhizophagus irregularis]